MNIKLVASMIKNGYHCWPGAPDHRSYLRSRHRHAFKISAEAVVIGDDRELELHDLEYALSELVESQWPNGEFGSMSCEQIGIAILDEATKFEAVRVMEDDWVGAEVRRKCTREESIPVIYGAFSGDSVALEGHMRVVTVCGSTRFKDETEKVIRELEESGVAVFSVGSFMHADGIGYSDEMKAKLDQLHKDKIAISDGIYVVNVDGYIGESTKKEIEFAEKNGKEVEYLCGPVRGELYWFSGIMESKLKKNDFKGGWNTYSMEGLLERMRDEYAELEEALNGVDPEDIAQECADVANFAMMIADNARRRSL